jgi:hypothetical protein
MVMPVKKRPAKKKAARKTKGRVAPKKQSVKRMKTSKKVMKYGGGNY